ncbi:TniB family NTP-binding protein [Comamonas sp. F1-6]|uniref:TniB family NTP-binding protein n=1 Tax=Comamonas sp. F1-6 TaxID=673550 RepID=UPI0031D182C8
MNSFAHLSDDAIQMLEASLPEKLTFLRTSHLFSYPAFEHILRDLQDLVRFPRTTKPECRAVIADSDNGKTTLTRKFLANNPVVLDEAGYPINKVLWVETPPSADERRLYSSILQALDITHRPDAPPSRLDALVQQELAAQQTTVLVLDELHAMLNSPARQQKQFMAALKRLSNVRSLSIVACGTVDVSRALAIDSQFVSRFTRLALPRWQANETFLQLLASFETKMPLPQPSKLNAPEKAMEIFKSSDGTIGSVQKITMRAAEAALKKGSPSITFKILQEECQSYRRGLLMPSQPPLGA